MVLSRGGARVIEVPRPQAMPGGLVVRVAYSVVSPGTERANLLSTQEPVLAKVRRRPELARQTLASVMQDGLAVTVERVRRRLADYVATGYSCAGTVVEVGSAVPDLVAGSAVACAGTQWAWHAEYVAVPRNLVCPVPDGVGLDEAASVALGGIAIQAVRQASVELGDLAVVIGLGTVGLLVVQLLRAAGASVLVADPLDQRRQLARRLGARLAVEPESLGRAVHEYTGGLGADRTIVTASTPSSEPLAEAMRVTRKRGVVVVVGDVGLRVARSPFYEKEIDLRISCSYGPGRYDPQYEERGVDYPPAYVRWTENRNMAAYLQLLRDRVVDWRSLVEAQVPVDQAPRVFDQLGTGLAGPAFTLRYPVSAKPGVAPAAPAPAPAVIVGGDCVRLGVVGAGSFARAVHLPHLKALRHRFRVVAVATRHGVTAVNAARQTGAVAAFTDYRELLQRDDIDAVLVATRHDLHAAIAAAALRAGKAVLLEKPLALDRPQLDAVLTAARTSSRPLLVGFNRRFSSACRFVRDRMARHAGAPLVLYRVNAPPGNGPGDWTLGPEGGGRAIGEACHMVDFLHALADSTVVDLAVAAAPHHGPPDGHTLVQLTFGNGLIASLLYTTAGARALGKERVEVFLGGEVVVVEDFRRGWVYGDWARGRTRRFSKGYGEEWEVFHRMCVTGEPSPISLDVLRSVTEATFRIRELAYTTCAASAER